MTQSILPGSSGLSGIDRDTWQDRLREAAYTSPGGTRITFDFTDVRRLNRKRTTAFEFPGVDGAYIQDNGSGPRRYPLRCFFSGGQHDLFATAFEQSLLERGVGKLQHPLYGTFNVVPFGEIVRRDDLVTAANQTVVEVTFFKTLGAIFPSAGKSAESEILAALAGFNLAEAQQWANSMNLAGALEEASTKATIRDFLLSVSDALGDVSEATLSVTREFRTIQRDINLGLDILIGQPLQLAQQISNMITLPARALAGIQSRLDAYGDLANSIFGSDAGNPAISLLPGTANQSLTTRVANDFHTADLHASSAVAGSVSSVLNNTFETKPDAIEAAEAVQNQFDAWTEFREPGFTALEAIPALGNFQLDTGEGYQALHQAVALSVGFLIEVSFSLVPERVIVLDRARTIIDLSAEVYGSVDDRLDFLINTNELSGSEILELKRGRVIRYYPDP